MARAIFSQQVAERQLTDSIVCDSAGTQGYHGDEDVDPRAKKCLQKRGMYKRHHAKKVSKEDLDAADYVVAMDKQNYGDLYAFSEENAHKLCLMRDFDTQSNDGNVPDPYHGTQKDFEALYVLLSRCTAALLNKLQ